MMAPFFEVMGSCPGTRARAGRIFTPHGVLPTPAFIPVGSQATVKALTPQELEALGARVVLGNTYHLYLRPGVEVVQRQGGLHRFMGWAGPLVTDSGGYQVFSLAPLCQVREEGVLFRSHIDGGEHFLTPERAMELQEALGADIVMAFDQPPAYGESRARVEGATERTHRWAERCQRHQQRPDQALFGIAQGGTFADLRRRSAQALVSLGFTGYAVGGLSLGEPRELTQAMMEETVSLLPPDRPRYLMGVGSPENVVEAVGRGIDLFDSALPTRLARHGALFTPQGRRNIRNREFREREGPLEPGCDCYTCCTFSAAYLHHLFKAEELLALRLATIHNLRFLMRLMERMRRAILEGRFPAFQENFLREYIPADEAARLAQREEWERRRRTKSGL